MKDGEDLTELARAIRAADLPLDEVTRARMQGRILDAAAAPPRGATAPRIGRLALAMTLVLVSATLAIVVIRGGRHVAVSGADTGTEKGEENGADDDRSFTHLEVPSGSKVDTVLAGRARITLTGPARVDVVSTSAALVVLRLPMGVLVGDYDHHAGGTLRIDSPGASTEVVGTLFAVEARAGVSRVSVARGRVQVRDGEQRLQMVGDGQSWSSERRSVGAMAPEAQRLFERQEPNAQAAALSAAAPAMPHAPDDGELRRAGSPSPAAGANVRRAASDARVNVARLEPERRSSPEPTASTEPPASQPQPLARTRSSSVLPAQLPSASLPGASSIARASVGRGTPVSPTSPPPLPVPAVRPEESAEALYSGAESAMNTGDLAKARKILERVIRTGSAPVAAAARFDIAHLAARTGDLDGAARILDEMLASDSAGPLREPARFFRCRVDLDRRLGELGAACLRRFLQDYPRSVDAASARQLIDQATR